MPAPWRASTPQKCSLTGSIGWKKSDGFRHRHWICAPEKRLLDEKHSKIGIFPHYPATTLTIWGDPLPELMVRKLKKGRLSFLTMNWLKQAVKQAEADEVHFSSPATPHSFRHSYIMHIFYHRQPKKVILALPGARIRAQWRFIRRFLRWSCRSSMTGMMPRKSSALFPFLSDDVTHHSLYKL